MNETIDRPVTDWHTASWERFVRASLPELIGRHCSLSTYRVERAGSRAAITLGVMDESQEIVATYYDVPMPDDTGVFTIEDTPIVVVPLATDEGMTDVECVGEQVLEFITQRIVPTAPGLLTDTHGLENWLPLTEWLGAFFTEHGQLLDVQNPIARETHVRRVKLTHPSDISSEAQLGKVCPFETPEGPWIGRVLTVAIGASIVGGEVVRLHDNRRPGDGLGPAASYIPFIDRSDPNRLLMGANMMRQWIQPGAREVALVRTGTEPADEDFWCGVNLLTAFMATGPETYEDAILLSESAATRLSYDRPIGVGDKLSNRHGQKGVVSRIAKDTDMPQLEDGRAVDCVVSFIGLHTRLNCGQAWEAAASWLAVAGGSPIVIEPYRSPTAEQLLASLREAGVWPQQRLRLAEGRTTERPVLVGWIYWGLTKHIALDKLRAAGLEEAIQTQGEMEYNSFRNNGLYAYIAESVGPMAEESENPENALLGVLGGEWSPERQWSCETAPVRRMRTHLAAAGIEPYRDEDGFGFRWTTAESIALPVSVRHPWMSWKSVSAIPVPPRSRQWDEVRHQIDRLSRLVNSDAPSTLIEGSKEALSAALERFYGAIVGHADVVPRGRRRFTGRAVIVPALDLRVDQVGIPMEMAWALFGPLAASEVGAAEVKKRSERARERLLAEMAERWVIVNRAPTLSDTNIVAFRPVPVPHAAVALHPLVCRWMNGDFDGDMVGVYLPLSREAQQEAGERISVVGHLRRNPALLRSLLPNHESLLGLAYSSLSATGREALRDIVGTDIEISRGFLISEDLERPIHRQLRVHGEEDAISVVQRLFDLGLGVVRRLGASLDLFGVLEARPGVGSRAEAEEILASSSDFYGPLGPQLLAVKSGARGRIEHLLGLIRSRQDRGREIGASQIGGLCEDDHMRLGLDERRRLEQLLSGIESAAAEYNSRHQPGGYNLLARLARATTPGVVIAHAADTGERDPLTEIDARLTVGLPVEGDDR